MFIKEHIMISRGRSLIGRAGVLISGPFPLVPKFLSQGNFGDDGHLAFGMSQGFLNFPKIKYLGSDSIIWKNSLILALFDSKSIFQNDLSDLDFLVFISFTLYL